VQKLVKVHFRNFISVLTNRALATDPFAMTIVSPRKNLWSQSFDTILGVSLSRERAALSISFPKPKTLHNNQPLQ
jgi:hypothetical protein